MKNWFEETKKTILSNYSIDIDLEDYLKINSLAIKSDAKCSCGHCGSGTGIVHKIISYNGKLIRITFSYHHLYTKRAIPMDWIPKERKIRNYCDIWYPMTLDEICGHD